MLVEKDDESWSAGGGLPAGGLLKQPRSEMVEARTVGQGGSRRNEDGRGNQVMMKTKGYSIVVLYFGIGKAERQIQKQI